MPNFPDKKNDQLVLCGEVGEGIVANPGDFPDPPFDGAALNVLVATAMAKIVARVAKEAELAEAVDEENEARALAVQLCKRYLAEAEARYAHDAAMLKKLGWNKRAARRFLKPGQVRNLEVGQQGPGTVLLDWKAPERAQSVGSARAYRIDRQIHDFESDKIIEEWGEWNATCFPSEEVLHNQPRGVEISYRIVATNTNGDGPASDVETVVL